MPVDGAEADVAEAPLPAASATGTVAAPDVPAAGCDAVGELDWSVVTDAGAPPAVVVPWVSGCCVPTAVEGVLSAIPGD